MDNRLLEKGSQVVAELGQAIVVRRETLLTALSVYPDEISSLWPTFRNFLAFTPTSEQFKRALEAFRCTELFSGLDVNKDEFPKALVKHMRLKMYFPFHFERRRGFNFY